MLLGRIGRHIPVGVDQPDDHAARPVFGGDAVDLGRIGVGDGAIRRDEEQDDGLVCSDRERLDALSAGCLELDVPGERGCIRSNDGEPGPEQGMDQRQDGFPPGAHFNGSCRPTSAAYQLLSNDGPSRSASHCQRMPQQKGSRSSSSSVASAFTKARPVTTGAMMPAARSSHRNWPVKVLPRMLS